MAPASPREALLRARLRSQLLVGEPGRDPLSVTRQLLAVQAQDPVGARLAIRARTQTGHRSDVDRALTDERSLVITSVNRGTLHLVASEDEPLLHALTTPQLRNTSDQRLARQGVSPAAAERALSELARALADGPLTRAEIRSLMEAADVPTAGEALGQIIFRATIDGLIVRGPLVGEDHAFVLAADWLGERPHVDREQGLAELARRYLAGHGPADAQDLAKWAQLPLRDVRLGLKLIGAELAVRSDGLLELARSRGGPEPSPAPRLLGPFDPILLGWRDREFVLDRTAEVILSNGIFRAVALVDGRVAGTWTRPAGRVQLNLWDPVGPEVLAVLEAEARAVAAYLGVGGPPGA